MSKDKITPSDRDQLVNQHWQKIYNSVVSFIRFCVASNAGGIIVTASLIGSIWTETHTPSILFMLPLTFFTLGLITSGITIQSFIVRSNVDANTDPGLGPPSPIDLSPFLMKAIYKSKNFPVYTMPASFLLFMLGAISALIILGCSMT